MNKKNNPIYTPVWYIQALSIFQWNFKIQIHWKFIYFSLEINN